MSLAPRMGKHSHRCLATPAHSLALWGEVTVFTGRDLAIYAKHSRVQSKLHLCLEIGSHKRLLLENASRFLLAVNYKLRGGEDGLLLFLA